MSTKFENRVPEIVHQDTRDEYKTSELGVAAYLDAKGFRIVSADKVNDNGVSKYEFTFDDPQHDADTVASMFYGDFCRRFDNSMQNVKKLLKITLEKRHFRR